MSLFAYLEIWFLIDWVRVLLLNSFLYCPRAVHSFSKETRSVKAIVALVVDCLKNAKLALRSLKRYDQHFCCLYTMWRKSGPRIYRADFLDHFLVVNVTRLSSQIMFILLRNNLATTHREIEPNVRRRQTRFVSLPKTIWQSRQQAQISL
jgi:hypothetical protein